MATAPSDLWPNNLWPDNLNELAFQSPRFHMLQQAVILGERTKHVLDGKVISLEVPETSIVRHEFTIIASALRYRFVLFSVEHTRTGLYPAFVRYVSNAPWPPEIVILKTNDPESTFEVKNESEFLGMLRFILSNEDTLEVLHALIVQSQENSLPFQEEASDDPSHE